MVWGLASGTLAVAANQPAEAQEAAAPACAAPVAPTGELAPWTTPSQLQAAANEAGRAARLTLLQTPEVRYPLRPEKPGGSVSYGGLIQIDVPEAGAYRLALDSAAWIDLVRGEQAT
jgi:hypothetical protein